MRLSGHILKTAIGQNWRFPTKIWNTVYVINFLPHVYSEYASRQK